MLKFNKESAEFVGIMLGDGYISYPNQQRLKISFNSKEKEYINFVNQLIIRIFNTKTIIKYRKDENTAELYLFNRKVIKSIVQDICLIPSPKWKKAKIPGWVLKKNLDRYTLRGYFDTDGSVVITNNNGIIYPRLEMKICPSPMQKQFIKIVKEAGFKFGVYDIGKGKIRIQINGKKELGKWVKLIGFSNIKHINKAKLLL